MGLPQRGTGFRRIVSVSVRTSWRWICFLFRGSSAGIFAPLGISTDSLVFGSSLANLSVLDSSVSDSIVLGALWWNSLVLGSRYWANLY